MPDQQYTEHLTQLLNSLDGENSESINQLLPIIYNELRTLARRELRRDRPDHTLNTTALVHEAYLKLVQNPPSEDWNGRRHFFSIAARAMRQILVNYARDRKRLKRGGGVEDVPFDDALYLNDEKADEVIALDEALSRLEQLNIRHSNVVEFRYFGGYSAEETAEIMGVSIATVNRDWMSARAWLFSQLQE